MFFKLYSGAMITIGRKSTRYRKRCSYRLEEAIISVANQSVIIFFVLCGHICPKISEVNIIGYYSEVVERTIPGWQKLRDLDERIWWISGEETSSRPPASVLLWGRILSVPQGCIVILPLFLSLSLSLSLSLCLYFCRFACKTQADVRKATRCQ